jgi:hypothetical protein
MAMSAWTRHRSIRRRSAAVLAGLLGASAAVSGLALAVGGGPGAPVPPTQFAAGQRAALATTPSAAGLGTLGVLRRAQTTADAVPSGVTAGLTEGVFSGAFGANVALARRVGGLTAGSAWVVPGDGSVCLIAASAGDPNGGATCASSAIVAAGGLEMEAGTHRAPGVVFVAGVAPDGVSQVTLHLSGGASQTLTVRDNVYMAEVHGAVAATTFAGAAPLAPTGQIGPAAAPTTAGTHAR